MMNVLTRVGLVLVLTLFAPAAKSMGQIPTTNHINPFTFSTPGRTVSDVGLFALAGGGAVVACGGIVSICASGVGIGFLPIMVTDAGLGGGNNARRMADGFDKAMKCGRTIRYVGYGIMAAGALTGIVGGAMILCENRRTGDRLAMGVGDYGPGVVFSFR